ncbi:MAG: sterol desaturase [Alphaproteobacteria bacterium]|nr:sterol desaturase [Alphaproteobacteria bacterium]|tara:strand:+ start:2853 stop:3878 length:1026 start_codon:yes stop_codon:yes gene_type:complete
MFEIIDDYINQIWEPLINPQKRIFIGYLASSFFLAFFIIIFQFRSSNKTVDIRKILMMLFSRRIWLSTSSFADYKILLISRFIILSIAPFLLSTVALTTIIFEWLHIVFDGRIYITGSIPDWAVAVIFSVSMFLVDDWTKYIIHKALHRVPLLWCFHKVHHTAEVLTPFTVYRTHPVEAIIFAIRSVISKSIVLAIFVYFFGSQVELLTVVSVSIFLFFFNLLGSNLRHSHVWLSYGEKFEKWLISPAQHQIHHSLLIEHRDQNFGAVLSIWDRINGSLYVTTRRKERIIFGVSGTSKKVHKIQHIFLYPFLEFYQIFTDGIRPSFKKIIPKQNTQLFKVK